MKQRFSSLDIKVISKELSDALCGLRVANIYDLSSRIFLFKFARPNDRKQVVVDSGFRCHLTSFSRGTAAEPSAFVARLRKFLRTRRVTAVSQVGTDRVIQLQFSDGQYNLILEFFAGGNIILTDRDLNIISLLRIVPKTETQEELRVGLRYSLESRQNYGGTPPLTEERVRNGLQHASGKVASTTTGKKSRQKPGDAVRKALANSLTEFPPMLLEHALAVRGFDFNKTIDDILEDRATFDLLMGALQEAQSVVEHIMAKPVSTGYIIAKMAKRSLAETSAEAGEDDLDKENTALMFDDFHPFLPKQVEGQADTTVLEIEGFNATVDQFFSSIESQKLEARLQERQDHANKKLQTARNDHAARVEGLQQVQQLNVRKAQAIENSILWVGEACAAVNGLIAQGMDWVEIDRLIEMEKARNNPVARLIHLPLKLYENTITLLLSEETRVDQDDGADLADETESENSDDDENKPRDTGESQAPSMSSSKGLETRLNVDIDLGLTPWANARIYYDQKKSAAVKEERTKQSSMKALKSTENKVKTDLQKVLKQEKEVLRPVRKQLWFEKYYYFISSEGYLVVAGRDKAQVDVLYSRYFQAGDAWVHSGVNGATPVIVKNKRSTRNLHIPPLTLSQAGSFCTNASSAWDSKAVMGSWWVECQQVTKIDSTGQYLAPGDFVIKGEKQELPPAQLLLGFGVMFRISAESRAKHNRHRLKDSMTGDGISNQANDSEPRSQDSVSLDPLHQEPSNEIYEDGESDHDAMDSDQESALPDTNAGDESAQPYSNPLQPREGETPQSAHMNTKLEDLSLEKENTNEVNMGEGSSGDEDGSEVEDVHGTMPVDETVPKEAIAASTVSDTASLLSKTTTQVRGKRGKRAKMKTKYADQDEEDRELAMQVLGSRPKQEKPKDNAEAKQEREALAAQQKERRREQHQSTQASGKSSEEERQKKIHSGQEIMGDEELAELDLVENFVGMPLPEDNVLDYLVVCGPWDAIGARLRWRTKIQPGSVKKGKAVKEIIGNWNRFIVEKEKKKPPPPEADTYAEEKQLRQEAGIIKGIKDVEVISIIPVGKVRLMTGGGEKNKGGKQATKSGKGGKKRR